MAYTTVIFVVAIQTGRIGPIVFTTTLLLFSVLTSVHYLWLYYFQVKDGCFVARGYFGLRHIEVPAAQLRVQPISEYSERVGRIPGFKMLWGDQRMVISSARYHRRDIARLIRQLDAAGATLDEQLDTQTIDA